MKKFLISIGMIGLWSIFVNQAMGPGINKQLLRALACPLPTGTTAAIFCSVQATALCVSGPASINGITSLGSDLLVGGTATIDGNLIVDGIIIGGTTATDFISAQDTTSQNIVTPTAFQPITVLTNLQINGWAHLPESADFVAPATGIYLISYAAQAGISSGANNVINVQAESNMAGTIAGSQAAAHVAAAADIVAISKTFLAAITAGDIISFQWTASAMNASLTAADAPSFSMTIIRIA